jgi:di/tricarboxylate transporter
MYNKNTDKDLISAGLTAALGAGVVTSFAVSQGQNPLIALAITAIAALFGVICHYSDLI